MHFYRLNNNLPIPVSSGTIFKCAEDFVDRYENVAISGLEYFMFIPRKEKLRAYRQNTRVYSCILIQNDISKIVFSILMLVSYFSLFFSYNLLFFNKKNINYLREDFYLLVYLLIIISLFFVFFNYENNFLNILVSKTR